MQSALTLTAPLSPGKESTSWQSTSSVVRQSRNGEFFPFSIFISQINKIRNTEVNMSKAKLLGNPKNVNIKSYLKDKGRAGLYSHHRKLENIYSSSSLHHTRPPMYRIVMFQHCKKYRKTQGKGFLRDVLQGTSQNWMRAA